MRLRMCLYRCTNGMWILHVGVHISMAVRVRVAWLVLSFIANIIAINVNECLVGGHIKQALALLWTIVSSFIAVSSILATRNLKR